MSHLNQKTMKTKTYVFGIFFALLALFITCENEPSQIDEAIQNTIVDDPLANLPRLENPYSVSNMRKALESLQSKTTKGPDNPYTALNIRPTHLYVKFTPRNEHELLAVKQDTLIELYDYPLDVEDWVINRYSESNYRENKPPQLWASIKVDQKIPKGCPSVVLERLFIPNENKINPRGKYNEEPFLFADELIEESFRLTENDLSNITAKAAEWTPSGNIKAQNRPLQGLKVRARRWFTTHVGFTNSVGNFTCNGKFKRPANYSLVFERKSVFDVRDGTFGQANVDGPKIKTPWVYNATAGRPLNYSYVYKAAFDYFYKNPFGTHDPPSSPGTSNALKISYYHQNGGSGFHAWKTWFTPAKILLPLNLFITSSPIRIYRENYTATKIYAVTAHEIAHAAHWKLIIDAVNSNRWNDYQLAKSELVESWAVFMETRFTRHFIDSSYKRWPEEEEYRRFSFNGYTDFFNEVFDTTNYTPLQMDQGLVGASNLTEWVQNIKNLYDGDETKLDDIFKIYNP